MSGYPSITEGLELLTGDRYSKKVRKSYYHSEEVAGILAAEAEAAIVPVSQALDAAVLTMDCLREQRKKMNVLLNTSSVLLNKIASCCVPYGPGKLSELSIFGPAVESIGHALHSKASSKQLSEEEILEFSSALYSALQSQLGVTADQVRWAVRRALS